MCVFDSSVTEREREREREKERERERFDKHQLKQIWVKIVIKYILYYLAVHLNCQNNKFYLSIFVSSYYLEF